MNKPKGRFGKLAKHLVKYGVITSKEAKKKFKIDSVESSEKAIADLINRHIIRRENQDDVVWALNTPLSNINLGPVSKSSAHRVEGQN